MLASPISQYFQESYSVSPLQNDQTSIFKLTEKLLHESERQSQIMMDSQFFQNQASYTPFLELPIVKKSVLEMSIKVLCESERQSQNLMDSQFYHNF